MGEGRGLLAQDGLVGGLPDHYLLNTEASVLLLFPPRSEIDHADGLHLVSLHFLSEILAHTFAA